jgi:hypothetical protein
MLSDPTGIRTQIKGTGILHSIHLTMGPFLKAVTKIVILFEHKRPGPICVQNSWFYNFNVKFCDFLAKI